MITLKCSHNPQALGDTIDSIFLAHMISKVENTRVNVQLNHKDQGLLNDLIGFGDVIIGKEKLGDVMTFSNLTPEGRSLYHKYSTQFKEIPLNTTNGERSKSFPARYVTAQWDAQQIYRRPDKYDIDKPKKIENWYRENMGVEIIRVGGEGRYRRLRDIIPIMSHAEGHIGADSGMMHIAKFLMPTDKIHCYHNITRRENDSRFPDGWDVAWMGREILRRGARLNYWELDEEQEKYFKDTSIYLEK